MRATQIGLSFGVYRNRVKECQENVKKIGITIRVNWMQ